MSELKNIPGLRFPTFFDEWTKMRFSDFISYTKGFAFKSKDYQNEGVRIVRVSDLGYDSIKSSNGIYFDKSKVHSVEKYVIEEGDIIVTTVGSRPDLLDSSVGRGILVRKNGEGLLNQNLVKINECEKVKNKFLFGFFNTKKYFDYITQIQRGNANQSNITLKDFFNYQVSIPSLPEQQKIADFLTAVDKRIELLEKKKTLLETYKKGVMKKIFTQEIRFKDDNGNDFPDWEEKRLDEICKIKRGKNIPSVENGQYYLLGMGSVDVRGRLLTSKYSDTVDHFLNKNDLIMPERDIGNGLIIGRVGLINSDNKYVLGANLLRLRMYREVNPIYIHHFINSYHFRKKIKRLVNGSAQLMITSKDIIGIKFFLPSEYEQSKISTFLTSIDIQTELLESQIDKSKNWKKGLLQKMFV